jgi:hypothetical protein
MAGSVEGRQIFLLSATSFSRDAAVAMRRRPVEDYWSAAGICHYTVRTHTRTIRHLNRSIASQSEMIASGSAALVRSIANAR